MAKVNIPTASGGGGGGVTSAIAGSGIAVSAATGAVTFTNELLTGKAGSQTIIGGTATTENLTLRPNGANATTGYVAFIGAPGATTAFISNAGSTGNIPQLVMGSAAAISVVGFINITNNTNGAFYSLDSRNAANGNITENTILLGAGGIFGQRQLCAPAFTTSGNRIGGTMLDSLTGSGNWLWRIGTGAYVWETGSNTERMRINNLGSVIVGTGLTTTATDGFLYIPSCAGVPTGVPVNVSSSTVVPLVWDRTNKKLYVYDFAGTAWIGGTVPGAFV